MPAADRDPTADPTRVHRMALRWRLFLTVAGPALALFMSWAAWTVATTRPAGTGREDAWFRGFMTLFLGGFGAAMLAAAPAAWRARIVLSDDGLLIRGLFREEQVRTAEFDGFRYLKGGLALLRKGRLRPLTLSWYERPDEIASWVMRHAQDLDRSDRRQEDRAIAADSTLGGSPGQQEHELARLRRAVRWISIPCYVALAAAYVNRLRYHSDAIEGLAVVALALVPVALDLFALAHRGHVRLEAPRGSRTPQVAMGGLAGGVGLALLSLSDRPILLIWPFARLVLPLLAVKSAIGIAIDRQTIDRAFRRPRVAGWFQVASIVLIASFWCGGIVYQANRRLDRSPASWSATRVVERHVSRSRSRTSYRVRLEGWDARFGSEIEVDLSPEEYERLEPGEPAMIDVRQGALGIPWVAAVQPRQAEG